MLDTWSNLTTKLKYKTNENQVSVVQIDAFYPSSKACSRCGSIKSKLDLSKRVYSCEECNLEIDRIILS